MELQKWKKMLFTNLHQQKPKFYPNHHAQTSIDEETLKNDGWKICEVRSVGDDIFVVVKRDAHDRTYGV